MDFRNQERGTAVKNMFVNAPVTKKPQCCALARDKFKADHHPQHPMTWSILKKIVLFILENSWFEFDDIVYSILSGTAMGQRHSVGVANSFMSACITEYTTEHPERFELVGLLKCLFEDLFGFCNDTAEEFDHWIQLFNHWSIRKGYQIQFQ